MIELNKIYNEDCFETMQKMCINKTSVDLVLTSQALSQEKDKLLFELFKKYGYSRQKVMYAFKRDTVKRLVQGNRETYYIDGKELFTIEKTVQQNYEKHTFTFTFREVVK